MTEHHVISREDDLTATGCVLLLGAVLSDRSEYLAAATKLMAEAVKYDAARGIKLQSDGSWRPSEMRSAVGAPRSKCNHRQDRK